ncbi:MAG TPA: DUF5686 and carboxypeptidase regulatory-like domain-containing protein [Arachidicoccus sp.]
MKIRYLLTIFLFFAFAGMPKAAKVFGIVKGGSSPLVFASITVKGTEIGTNSNQNGTYVLNLSPGKYTLVCRYVGFTTQQQVIEVGDKDVEFNFQMSEQTTKLPDVIVGGNGEDPANAIIRHAIMMKKNYVEPMDSFSCNVYIKTAMKTRKLPSKILGKKIKESDRMEMGVDSLGKGTIFLSESVTKVSFAKPDKTKLEIVSGRESGSNGYGFNFPTFINFYKDNVNVLSGAFNPRGYVSPIADAAFNFYKFKFLGTFEDEGKLVNKIQVIPKRSYEPVFSGIISITDGDWRIYSLDLLLTKTSQLQLLDTVVIKQMAGEILSNIWATTNQSIYFTFNIFAIDAVGSSLNVYNNYNNHPGFAARYFNNIIATYDSAANKKDSAYWTSVRPVQLSDEEIKNFHVKDSAFNVSQDSAHSKARIDSLRKMQGKISAGNVFWSGFTRSDYKTDYTSWEWKPLLANIEYNTAEGFVLKASSVITHYFPKWQRPISFTPMLRYGFSNTHLNASAILYIPGKIIKEANANINKSGTAWTISGGKNTSQFNSANPISPLINEFYTLFFKRNYMKIYEKYFGTVQFQKKFQNGFSLSLSGSYEDRMPLNNTTDFSFFHKDRVFTPNYPVEKSDAQFSRHQAVLLSANLQYTPGMKYIRYPYAKVAVGSKYPTFELMYQKGIDGLLGSDVNFDKWKFSIYNSMNFKLAGTFKYNVCIGGFLNANSVYIQDYQHFNGNQTAFASAYVNSFQLSPYYANSTIAHFYATANIEHHFNGMLTNKIPLFKRLNWNLVAGSNAYYVNSNNNYVEVFAGLENIFKIIRIDAITSYLNGRKGEFGIRIGAGGLFGFSRK